MGVGIPNSRGHSEAWESVSPTRGATPQRGSPYPQLKGGGGSVGVCIPNSRGHTEVWESKKKKKERKWEAKVFNLSCPHAEGPQQKQEVALCVLEFP